MKPQIACLNKWAKTTLQKDYSKIEILNFPQVDGFQSRVQGPKGIPKNGSMGTEQKWGSVIYLFILLKVHLWITERRKEWQFAELNLLAGGCWSNLRPIMCWVFFNLKMFGNLLPEVFSPVLKPSLLKESKSRARSKMSQWGRLSVWVITLTGQMEVFPFFCWI